MMLIAARCKYIGTSRIGKIYRVGAIQTTIRFLLFCKNLQGYKNLTFVSFFLVLIQPDVC